MSVVERPKIHMRAPRVIGTPRIIVVISVLTVLAVALVAVRYWPRPPLASRIPSSVAVLDTNGRLLRLTLSSDQQYRLWTPLDEVSPQFVEALLLQESRPAITLHLARLLYGINTRTFGGRLQQIAFAVGLELRYSKREILEAHMNLMPHGGNVQGVGAASLIYFGKRPSRLALNEALTLVLIPQTPGMRPPLDGEDEPPTLTAARQRLFARWLTIHPEDKGQNGFMAVRLHYGSVRDLPFEAPHFTNTLLTRSRRGRAARGVIQTTLDVPRQRTVERVLQGYVREQHRVGIRNAAALLVDYRDMGVRAMVGSAQFSDESIDGQVNGTRAKRSPGLALAPFIYALAIDQGAEPSFYQFLHDAGISHMASERHYGPALALGGGEVTMEETATLYAMLANDGLLRSLRYRADDTTNTVTQLLSEQASFMTLEMLQSPRPDATAVASSSRLPVAWTTGTSPGFRDAWAVGLFGHYVLVVWVGNFDGSSNPAFVGTRAAAPLFFHIIDAVQAAEPDIGTFAARAPPNAPTRASPPQG